MEYVLVISFLTTSGKKSNITIEGVKPNLTQAEIGTLMDSFIANNIFCPQAGEFIEKAGANVTQRTVTSYEF